MARCASGAAQENPLQIGAVAHGISARSGPVRTNVIFMEGYVVIPGGRMNRRWAAQMALRTGRSRPRNTLKVSPVAVDIGTGRRSVRPDIDPVQGVRKISPPDGMNRVRIAEVALGAGDF
jgi:hypothetical protein